MIDEKIDWTTEAHLLNDLGHDDQEAFEAEVEALTNQRLHADTPMDENPNKKSPDSKKAN